MFAVEWRESQDLPQEEGSLSSTISGGGGSPRVTASLVCPQAQQLWECLCFQSALLFVIKLICM